MSSSNLLKKLEDFEKIFKRLDKVVDLNYLYSQGIINDDMKRFIINLEANKLRIESDKISDEEILNLSKKIDDIKQFLLTKFYHYI
jgi:hypothetical protein